MNNEDLVSDDEVLRGNTDFRMTIVDEDLVIPVEEFAMRLREDSLRSAEEARIRTPGDLSSFNSELQNFARSFIRGPAPVPLLVKKKVRHLKRRDGFYKIEGVPNAWVMAPNYMVPIMPYINRRVGISFSEEEGLSPSAQMSSIIDLQFRLDRVVQKPYKKSLSEVVEHYYYEEI